MKLKSGPLLVVGILVLLIGLTVMLTPSPPPPAPDPHDHDQEHEKEAAEPKKEQKAPEKPTLAQIQKLLAMNDPHAHSDAIDKLTELAATARTPQDRKPITEFLMELVKDRRENIRLGAVKVLAGLGAGDGQVDYRVLLTLARQDPSINVKQASILALAAYPAGGPVEQALQEFAKHPDAGVRSVAMISLTQVLGSAAGNDKLVALLGQFDNDASAKAAMRFHAQGAPALPTLIKALQTSPSGPARHAAAMCIGLICGGFNPEIERFAKQAQVTHRQEQGHKASNPAGVEPLIAALQRDKYAPTREIAAQGLGYIGDARAVKPLAGALQDSDPSVRRRAAAALITLPAQSVVPELSAAATHDRAPEVRRFAVEALGWVGGAAVVPALNQATADPDPAVRRYAAVELGRIADPSALQALSAMLDDTPDPDPDVRWAAVVALGKLRNRSAEAILVKALSDPSPQVSNSAERALQRLGIARQEQAGYEG